VIAPASTGRERRSKIAVIFTAQINRDMRSKDIPVGRILITVEIKLIAPRIEETPAICNLKIAKSTEEPSWAILADRGGYTVQPVPAPLSTILLINRNDREGGSSQNLILLRRGKAISGAPNIRGTSQLPNPPIIIGITIKKIIIKA
jgi:hypothetical protein